MIDWPSFIIGFSGGVSFVGLGLMLVKQRHG